MLDKEKFQTLWEIMREWDKGWCTFDEVGLDVDKVLGKFSDMVTEELFYAYFPMFPRGKVILSEGNDKEYYMSWYEMFIDLFYSLGDQEDSSEAYEAMNMMSKEKVIHE